MNIIRFYAFKTNYPYNNTVEIANYVGLKPLTTRRLVYAIMVMDTILNGVIDYPELLQKKNYIDIITLLIVRCTVYQDHVIYLINISTSVIN
jgi:hypothetical protein